MSDEEDYLTDDEEKELAEYYEELERRRYEDLGLPEYMQYILAKNEEEEEDNYDDEEDFDVPTNVTGDNGYHINNEINYDYIKNYRRSEESDEDEYESSDIEDCGDWDTNGKCDV